MPSFFFSGKFSQKSSRTALRGISARLIAKQKALHFCKAFSVIIRPRPNTLTRITEVEEAQNAVIDAINVQTSTIC